MRLTGRPDVDEMRRNGLQLGRNVYITGGGEFIDPDFAWLISIGDDSIISLGVMILAHDASTKRHLGYTRVAPVTIGRRVFVGARSLILPGVTIGDDAIVAAGSIVRHDVPAGTVVAGSPARPVGSTEDYIARHRDAMAQRPVFEREYTVRGGVDAERKAALAEAVSSGEGYVR